MLSAMMFLNPSEFQAVLVYLRAFGGDVEKAKAALAAFTTFAAAQEFFENGEAEQS